MRLWVARLHISARTEAKIRGRHGLDPFEIREHIECRRTLDGRQYDDPARGRQYIVKVTVGSQRIVAVLYASRHGAEDEFDLASAYLI